MHVRISTWQVVRPDEYDAITEEASPHLGELTRQPGYIAGYQVRPTPERLLTITVWEDEASQEAAFEKMTPALSGILEGRVELVDRTVGPAEEMA